MIGRVLLRPLAYLWAFPTTAVGLVAVGFTLLSGGRVRLVRGVLETHGGFSTWYLTRVVPLDGGASAMTLGHVVIGRDQPSLDRTREHEHVHVRQCERWGPFFIPAYLLASLVVYWQGGSAYYDNPFEREAFETTEPEAARARAKRDTDRSV